MRNGADPNYVPTEEELKAIAAKEAMATQHLQERRGTNSVSPNSLGYHVLSVGTWLEPNDWAHRNYCGPGSTQVALDARLATSDVPSIDTLGTEENIDPNWGVYTTAIRDVLNTRLNTTWYVANGASGEAGLKTRIVTDIDAGYAMVTGVRTGLMPGWGGYDVNHLVAVYGYNEPNASTLYAYYTETAGSVAGYNGTYRNTATGSNFWNYVSGNNSQVW